MHTVLRTRQFNEWFECQNQRVKHLVQSRLDRMELFGHLGFTNFFDGIIELKWNSGLRLYAARFGHQIVILIGGTNMAKAKTSRKQKRSSKKSEPVLLFRHKLLDESVLDRKILKELVLEALVEGDMEMLKDVLVTLIALSNKTALGRKSKLGRQTLYDLINDKREFNPTVKTLSSLLKVFAA